MATEIDAVCTLAGSFTLRSGRAAEYFDKFGFEADPALF
jgi:hypothetical protein